MATIPLTKRGADKLKDELARLKSVERHAVIQAIAEARAQGDLSENAEYEAAKDKQGFIEGRILEPLSDSIRGINLAASFCETFGFAVLITTIHRVYECL